MNGCSLYTLFTLIIVLFALVIFNTLFSRDHAQNIFSYSCISVAIVAQIISLIMKW